MSSSNFFGEENYRKSNFQSLLHLRYGSAGSLSLVASIEATHEYGWLLNPKLTMKYSNKMVLPPNDGLHGLFSFKSTWKCIKIYCKYQIEIAQGILMITHDGASVMGPSQRGGINQSRQK